MNSLIKSGSLVEVMLPSVLDKKFTYKTNVDLEIGSFIQVPFKNRQMQGIVWNVAKDNNLALSKIKEISSVLDIPVLSKQFKDFLESATSYNFNSVNIMLKMVMPDIVFLKSKPDYIYRYITSNTSKKLTQKQSEALEWLKLQNECFTSVANKKFSRSIWQGLIKHNAIAEDAHNKIRTDVSSYNGISLSDLQINAINSIREDNHNQILIDGVPGSGKSEVYFEIINDYIKQGKQALILLPEIALTSQFIDRVESRFSIKPYIWHSKMLKLKKQEAWQNIVNGTSQIVIGTRSALFLPYKNLGIVVVDEEHEPSYKQEDSARYNARDMAIYRSKFENFKVLLVSATPSLETLYNVSNNKYGYVKLEKRYAEQALPEVELIDLLENGLEKGKAISKPLVEAIKQTLEKKEQVLLFLNRRGFSPLSLCDSCGYKIGCPNCSVNLVEHRFSNNILLCHKCGYKSEKPKVCPSCGNNDTIKAWGVGVEKLEAEVVNLFPNHKTLVATSDTIKSVKDTEELIKSIENNDVDIIIGTQILAKGYHFPNLTLVGVVEADLSVTTIDLRHSERIYQLLYQVSGRAGRSKKSGKVLLQTYDINSKLLNYLKTFDRDNFVKYELENRKNSNMPPYTRIIAGIITNKLETKVESISKEVLNTLSKIKNIDIYGPAPAPISKLGGNFRYRFIIRISSQKDKEELLSWYKWIKEKYGFSVSLDVDPMSFF